MNRRSFFAMLTGGFALPFVPSDRKLANRNWWRFWHSQPQTLTVTYRAGHSLGMSKTFKETFTAVLKQERKEITRQVAKALEEDFKKR